MSIIERGTYLAKVEKFIEKDLIKVFIGQRRVGKSYLLKATINNILNKLPHANIIYIDKELYDYDHINTYHDLINFVENELRPETNNYLFIDEIQEISDFQKALRHFQNKRSADIYISGSNADMLSGELATLLSGRYIEISVNSLSYLEFLDFHQLKDDDESLFKYLKWGGLPYIKNIEKSDEVIFEYLKNILSTIVYRDILHRYKIRNVDFFDRLILYTASNVGNLITSKKIFEINNKYYFEDWGLRNALIGINRYSVPDILENVVFSHLKFLGYKLSVGVLKNLEIDFIAEKSDEKIYIQVAYLITDEKVKQREFGNLLQIKDNYPKYVVSLDPVQLSQIHGVKHIHLREFLTKKRFDI